MEGSPGLAGLFFFDLDGLSSADDGQVIPAAGQKVPTLLCDERAPHGAFPLL